MNYCLQAATNTCLFPFKPILTPIILSLYTPFLFRCLSDSPTPSLGHRSVDSSHTVKQTVSTIRLSFKNTWFLFLSIVFLVVRKLDMAVNHVSLPPTWHILIPSRSSRKGLPFVDLLAHLPLRSCSPNFLTKSRGSDYASGLGRPPHD